MVLNYQPKRHLLNILTGGWPGKAGPLEMGSRERKKAFGERREGGGGAAIISPCFDFFLKDPLL